ncbi:MAG: NADH-quinone oxidoreductase subunit L [Planctomycetota bacterium]|nr:NADH-quinone oxidoreductase subunit L [Planctomycetota bacterium]
MFDDWLLHLCLIVLAAPLAGFCVQYVWGRRLGAAGAWLTCVTMFLSLACSVLLGVAALSAGAGFDVHLGPWSWLEPGDGAAWNIGIRLDGLTVVMLVVVTLVSFLVHVFSTRYMEGDAKYPLFFAWLQMFSFSMLVLVLADNLLHLFMGWELVGLCSYKLIGFWSEKPAPCLAARKAFITTRIGDLGMMIALCAIGTWVGSFEFDAVFAAAAAGEIPDPWLLIAGLGLFLAAAGKSAQLPLHVWLPDAMEGPTPVSALIHAATMVAAGVYLVGRCAPMLTPDVLVVVATVGAVTALVAGLIALAQNDIKRVLAYSTVSQLGYMFLGLGVGAWHAGLFHLTTHAFFKALMFLGSGSVIHGCHHEQDMRRMGGLRRKMPITAWTFLIGVLAIAGVPWITSGFFSKDGILSGAYGVSPVLFWIGLGGAVLTAFYMMRLYVLTFEGEPRDAHVHDHAHESPRAMTVPLLILAALTLIIGPLAWHEILLAPPTSVDPAAAWGTLQTLAQEHHHAGVVMWLAIAAGVGGLALGWLVFHIRRGSLEALKRPFAGLERVFAEKFWFDELYAAVLLRPADALARGLRRVDEGVVDGLVNAAGRSGVRAGEASGAHDRRVVDGLVRLVGHVCQGLGGALSALQSGRVRLYLSLSVGLLALALLLEHLL